MSATAKFLVTLAACAVLILVAAATLLAILFSGLEDGQSSLLREILVERAGALALVALLMIAILGMLLHALIRAYVTRPLQLAEETRLITTSNPAHRLAHAAPVEMSALAAAINSLAERCTVLQSDLDARVAEARSEVERERNVLAALMADLTESVIVCNAAGTILLYNERARRLFDAPNPITGHPAGATEWLGLGRSVFGAIDREIVAHALEDLNYRMQEGRRYPISEFVTSSPGGRLLRARMTAIASPVNVEGGSRTVSAVVIVLDDIQREVHESAARERALKSLSESTRASVANIRAAAEAVLQHPSMTQERQQQFIGVIHDETQKLSARMQNLLSDKPGASDAEWPLTPVLARHLMHALQRALQARCAGPVLFDMPDEPIWLAVDSFVLIEALSHLVQQLTAAGHAGAITLRLEKSGSRAKLELAWQGAPLTVDQAVALEHAAIRIPGQAEKLSLQQIAARHGGEFWFRRDEGDRRSAFNMLVSIAPAEEAIPKPGPFASSVPGQPVYYDFDLLHLSNAAVARDDRALSDLIYTVFDTETTGLQPSRGDEIISIGAVRIVNGRLLAGEAFQQLINPRRAIDKASIEIHGLTPDMLADQPTIEAVLPRFHRYCGDTVLVAHNAAFDMRFLQLKEPATGVKFEQPLLDTLLLSAVVHPQQTDHSLEAIAQRLGLNIIGRHTALGDAFLTGEIFLKFIGLLGQQGIVTFREAQQAAQRTMYAKVQY
jgi:DNA polymerase-3 subunit epsilon